MDYQTWSKVERQRLLLLNIGMEIGGKVLCLCDVGIFCLDRLEPVLDLVSSSIQMKESKLIVQKYIGEDETTDEGWVGWDGWVNG